MDEARASAHAGAVSRVVITSGQPQHLSRAEADAWLFAEVATLCTLPGVESVVLSRARGSRRYGAPWAWLCELHLAEGANASACAEHPLCTEWMMDLGLLGMRPAL